MSNVGNYELKEEIIKKENRNIINYIEEDNSIINSSREPKIKDYQFINPDHEIKWQWTNKNTYHFKQDIERVWLFLRSFEFICLLSNEGHYPCINIKGKDTWKVGNTFKGNLYNIYPFVARVEKVLNFPEMKEIKWLFNFLN